jgi:hypothetical protein
MTPEKTDGDLRLTRALVFRDYSANKVFLHISRRLIMSPNDVELVRVYTKELGGKISDTTLAVSSGFEVIVEAEAGSAIHSSGAQFLTNILVRDLSANDIIPATPTQAVSGAMSSSAWPELYRALQYKVNKADLTGRENHVCQVIAFLNVGVNNPDVSFAVSPFSILTK